MSRDTRRTDWPTARAKARARRRPTRRTTAPPPPAGRAPTPGALARSLVERGLASRAILDGTRQSGPPTDDPRSLP